MAVVIKKGRAPLSWFKKYKKFKIRPEMADDLVRMTQKEMAAMLPLHIIVAGKTGSGKSTLINGLFREKLAETGVGVPITQHVQQISKEGIPLVLYDTRGLELNPQAQGQVLETVADLIKRKAAQGKGETIDLVYYCINANMGRIEPTEIDFIKALAAKLPVIIVLTQAIGEGYNSFEAYLQALDLPVQGIVPTLAKSFLLHNKQYIQAFGLETLINLSLAVLPQDRHQAFINAQRVDLQRKVDSARSWAKGYISTAFGIGFTPIPFADSALLVPMQLGMLAHISAIFGVSLDKTQLLSIFAGFGGTGGVTFIGKNMVASLFKMVPGLGTVSAGVITGSTASVLTVALAYSYIEVLRRIALAEITGRDLPLKEIQKIMNQNLKEQFDTFSRIVPDPLRDKLIPEWLSHYLK